MVQMVYLACKRIGINERMSKGQTNDAEGQSVAAIAPSGPMEVLPSYAQVEMSEMDQIERE